MAIIAWANGACANSPWEHVNFLSEVASYGFLVIALGPMSKEGKKGTGKSTSDQMITAKSHDLKNSTKFFDNIVSKGVHFDIIGQSC